MAWDNRVPFHPHTGSQQHYPEAAYAEGEDGKWRRFDPDWRENSQFEDTLTFTGFSRGRSAAYATFKRRDGTNCTMFLAELEAAMRSMDVGIVQGVFTWCKRGANFGIKLVEAKRFRGPGQRAGQQIFGGDRR